MSIHLSAIDGGYFRSFPYQERERGKIYQFDPSRGIHGFPEKLEDVEGVETETARAALLGFPAHETGRILVFTGQVPACYWACSAARSTLAATPPLARGTFCLWSSVTEA